MSYNGSGVFVINTAGQPVVTGTSISSSVFNALTADLATGLSTAITKDGQTATTARIPFAAGINSTLVTDATSTTTGSIITAGGAGVAKALFVGTTANVAGAVTLQSTLGVTGITTFSAQPIFSSLTASSAVATDASKGLVSVTNTGTGNNVLATSPTLVTPVLGAASATSVTVAAGAVGTPSITTVGDTNTGIFFPAADTIAFSEGGAEAMRLDSSGNVGIGTSSPQARLHESSTNDGVQAIFTGAQTGTTQTILLRSQYQTNNGTAGFANIGWLDNGSQGGSLTLGTTSNGGGTTGIPTERMRIDSTGNVGIGTSTPSAKLTVVSGTNGGIVVNDGTVNTIIYNSTGGVSSIGTTTNHPVDFYANNAARMRIDSSGNVGIGTSSGSARLNVNGGTSTSQIRWEVNNAAFTQEVSTNAAASAYVYKSNDASYHVWKLSNAESMRLDSSGSLLVGTTSAVNVAKQTIAYFSGNNGLAISTTDDLSATDFAIFRANSATCGVISRVGTTSAVVYTATSDYRLKTVVGAVSGQGARIDALEPIEYTWNSNGLRTRGFLAHKFQEVYADSVTGTKDAVDADGNPVYQAMQASSSEVIADLVAEIQDLRKRLAALEST